MNSETSKSDIEKKKSKSYIFTLNNKARLPFSVNTILNLDIKKKDDEKFRFTSKLLGWLRPDYMLISASYESDLMFAKAGTEIIARYLFEGQIYGFTTQLMNKQSDPFPLWFLSFPEQIEVINLRSSSRYPIICEITDQNGITCYTKDISEDGALIIYKMGEGDLIKNLGETLELNFFLPDGTAINELKTEIVRKYTDSDQQILGVSFNKEHITELEKISNFLNKLKSVYNWDEF